MELNTLALALQSAFPAYGEAAHTKVAERMVKNMERAFRVEVGKDDEGCAVLRVNTNIPYKDTERWEALIGAIGAHEDLLEALERIDQLVDKMNAWNDTRDEIQTAARAAIAKAYK